MSGYETAASGKQHEREMSAAPYRQTAAENMPQKIIV